MPEFIALLPPREALENFLGYIKRSAHYEKIDTKHARGRVALSDIRAPHSLPSFPRSTVDGYAVAASDTHGASESLPVYLKLLGEVRMGESPEFELSATQCGLIHTGGMLPSGSDAVVMLENTQPSKPGEVEVLRSVATGENLIKVGEDVNEGETVIPSGKFLGPAEIGGLLALGITKIDVVKQPVIGIISSGDEVVAPEEEIQAGQVRDINSYTLSSLVEQSGGIPIRYGVVPDEAAALRSIMEQALLKCDLVVVTAGSSASARDLTSQVINSFDGPGVISHGVNIRPGKPTILAACMLEERKNLIPVIGLPGNPVSALVIAILFVQPVIDKLHGMDTQRLRSQIKARLKINLASQAGREDWVPVKISRERDVFTADPIFGKSNLIFTLAHADGLLHIPPEATGINAGEMGEVLLL